MSLPLEVNVDEIALARPGDAIFKDIEPFVASVKERSKAYQEKILQFILRDLYIDLALSEAVDKAGAVVEYLAQDLGIEKPEFDGGSLLRNLQRLSKLRTAMDFGRMLEMSDQELEAVLSEEVERLWFDQIRAAAQSKQQKQTATLSLPEDLLHAVRSLIKVNKPVSKGK